MSRLATVHVCPVCRKSSVEGGEFQMIIYPEKPIPIDGFKYCSVPCRLAWIKAGASLPFGIYQLKREGIRSAGFRKDRLDQ